jgi:hypothetical protein
LPNYRVTIDVRDVARGDILNLVDDIMHSHGKSFDASRGDFVITASVEEHGSYFPIDLDYEDED